MKKVENRLHKYYCEYCDYKCCKTSHWKQHIMTRKHKNGKNGNSDDNKKKAEIICPNCSKKYAHKSGLSRHLKTCKIEVRLLSKITQYYSNVIHGKFECKCGKSYKYASGLSKHKSKCKHLQTVNEIITTNEIIHSNNVEVLLKTLIKKNDSIIEENKELRNEIKNLKLGNTMINSNNNNNNSFNINFFLNEKCKNAMNLEDFVEKIKLTLEDLQFTKDNGYVKGISNIFIKNLNDMDITERPIHCSDQKRLQFYVKNDNEWTRDKNNEKIDNSIEKVSLKQMKSIREWVKENPNYLESTAKTEEYFTLVRSITQPNDNKNLKNIKRKVGENVKLEKSENVK